MYATERSWRARGRISAGVVAGCAAAVLAVAPVANAASSPLGKAGKSPKGSPITLGMINMEGGAAGSDPEVHAAAEAAVNYVNDYLGGAAGHPLKLAYCVSTGDPSASANCANQFVSSKPLAVLGGADLGTSGSVPILQKAGIPYVGGMGFNPQELESPDSIQWTSAARAMFSGIGVFVGKVLKPTKVGIVYYNNIPSGANALEAIESSLEAEGIKKANITAAGRATTDTSDESALAALAGKSPQVVVDINAGNTCVSAIQGAKQLLPNAKLVTQSQCTQPSTLKAVGSAMNGVYLATDYEPVTATSDPDVKKFLAAMKKWEPSAPLIETTEAGFSEVINTAKAIDAVGAKVNSKKLLAWFKKTKHQPSFLQSPYTCAGQYQSSPSLCRGGIQMTKFGNGTFKPVTNQWYDGMKFFPKS